MPKIKQPEKIIREILEKLYPESRVEYNDTGEEENQFDFLVMREDNTTIAVEGTTECDKDEMQLDRLLQKYTQSSIEHNSLNYTWKIDLFKETKNIKKLVPQLKDILLKFENCGIGDFDTEEEQYFRIRLENFQDEAPEKYNLILDELRDKFVRVRGNILYQSATSKIYLENGGRSASFVIPSSINKVIKKHIEERKDNVRKLSLAKTDQKQLFICKGFNLI